MVNFSQKCGYISQILIAEFRVSSPGRHFHPGGIEQILRRTSFLQELHQLIFGLIPYRGISAQRFAEPGKSLGGKTMAGRAGRGKQTLSGQRIARPRPGGIVRIDTGTAGCQEASYQTNQPFKRKIIQMYRFSVISVAL